MTKTNGDWNETEKEYLRRNQGIRESIMQWAEYNYSDGCWTEANLEFLEPGKPALTKCHTRALTNPTTEEQS